MENMLYREITMTLKTLDRSPCAVDFTKEETATIRFGLGTRFIDVEKFHVAFNRVIRDAVRAFNKGIYYSAALTVFIPYGNEKGEYARADFHEWPLSVSRLAAGEILLCGNGTKETIILDTKNPYKSLVEQM